MTSPAERKTLTRQIAKLKLKLDRERAELLKRQLEANEQVRKNWKNADKKERE